MADNSSKSKDQTPAPDAPADQSKVPQLGALEEDDEFEEFPAADWDNSETTLANLTKNSASSDPSKPTAVDQLWEDNWDDDDVEDDFSKQLREELAKTGGGATSAPQQQDTVMS
ncbi:hypothetical protein FS837_003625 [Tulasnella sp. UAMH 9824]|nr:hypothetical protein FS837_003625 [Tulasnella sp. UAMH 9824]